MKHVVRSLQIIEDKKYKKNNLGFQLIIVCLFRFLVCVCTWKTWKSHAKALRR
jgi:succinate-acetate transporter protein